jgi:hypothetical protein
MRNYLSCIGILAVVFVNVAGLVGCAGRETEPKTPIVSQNIEIPAPTPADTDKAQQNLSEAWSVYWRTQYAKAKAEMCKP